MLPTLTAVLAGALVAGAASVLTNGTTQSAADQPELRIGLSDELVAVPEDLVRPAPSTASSGVPNSSGTPATSVSPPTSSSSAKAPAPPPPSPSTSEEQPPPPPPTATGGSAQDQVVDLVNTFRGEAGCGPVKVDDQLTTAAQLHAEDMSQRDYFSHNSPDGRTFDQRIRNAGYPSPGAENIARGSTTAEDVMRLWMESDGHRRNILNCDLNTLGVGLDLDGFYWVQDFGF